MSERFVSPSLEDLGKLRQPLTVGEHIVLDYFLNNLPASWEVYIQPHLNGLRPDFVLLHPENGIAVYEVKDWNLDAMEYFVEEKTASGPKLMARKDGKQFLIEKQNPVPKIDLYKNEIYTLYCPRLPSKQGYGAIVSGIIFPFASDEKARKLLDPLRKHYGHVDYPSLYPVIGADTIGDTGKWSFKKNVLPTVYKTNEGMRAGVASDLRHWLVEPEFSAEQRRPLIADLSLAQRRLVTSRTATGFRRIKGAAGSGKTFVLAGRAAVLAGEGKRVLVITFNITLINYILDMAVRFAQTGEVKKQIVALNFHIWCKRVALASGHADDYARLWRQGDAGNVLKSELALVTRKWLKDLDEGEKWDAILVDEGQDFELAWWVTLRQALRPDGEALLCADRTQNIYDVPSWTEEEMKGAGFRGDWGSLEQSFRLSPKLCELAKEFINEFFPDADAQRPEPIEGEFEFKTVLKWWQINAENAAHYCVTALMEIVEESEPPISYADLTCLVENETIGTEVVRLLMERGIRAIDTFGKGTTPEEKRQDGRRKKQAFYKGDSRVKVTTLHSFKGWESKAIVVHVGNAESESALALAYVGMTRLKRDDFGCYLTVVSAAPELVDYGKKWPFYREMLPVLPKLFE